MSTILLYIVWNPNPTAFLGIRWYSLCWLIGLILAYLSARYIYKDQHIKDEVFDPLFIYCFLGVLIGARLGHCLFYEPAYFLSSPIHFAEMLLPVRFLADGGIRFTGYEGLSSHGGIIGVIIGLYIYKKRNGLSMWFVLDVLALSAPITGCLIRLGNLMNSEIIGKVTDVPWAFIFERVDLLPRHPGQLYEAIAYFALFIIGFVLYRRLTSKVGSGFFFGHCMVFVFVSRFLIEFVKADQEAFEADMLFNMGQLLSIPFIIFGIYSMLRKR